MRTFLIGLMAVLLSDSLLLAQQGTLSLRPTGPRDQANLPRWQNLTPEEQQKLQAWAKENMPNLLTLAIDAPRPRRGRLMNVALFRQRALEQPREENDRERIAESIKIEDAIFGYVLELDQASADQRAVIRTKIRAKTLELVDAFLAERAARLEKLKARLEAEQQKLDEDRAKRDQLVEMRLAHFMIDVPTSNESPEPAPGGNVITSPEKPR
jgi:hypothetical protein